MGKVTYRDGIAILQLLYFTPAAFLALFLCLKHGFGKSSGWYFLITFSLLRMIGSICTLIEIDHYSKEVATASIICTSIGLAPLNLVCLGLLSRVNEYSQIKLTPLIWKAVSLVSTIGLILGIYGGTQQAKSTDYTSMNAETKTAVIIFTLIYCLLVCLTILFGLRISQVQAGEKRLVLAVAISVPFIGVRLIYALVSDFAHSSKFNSIYGNATIYLCMAVLEELIATTICLGVGMVLRKAPPKEEPVVVEDVQLESKESHSPAGTAGRVTEVYQSTYPKWARIGILGRVIGFVWDKVGEKRWEKQAQQAQQ